MANRKQRKKRQMELKKQGLESFTPAKDSKIMTNAGSLPRKLARRIDENSQISARLMWLNGYEFTKLANV